LGIALGDLKHAFRTVRTVRRNPLENQRNPRR
jgi:hypothetical protein